MQYNMDIDNYLTLYVDGICLAPTNRRTKHLSELEPHETNTSVLPEATNFRERVFIHEKSDRKVMRYQPLICMCDT